MGGNPSKSVHNKKQVHYIQPNREDKNKMADIYEQKAKNTTQHKVDLHHKKYNQHQNINKIRKSEEWTDDQRLDELIIKEDFEGFDWKIKYDEKGVFAGIDK